ncbi:MAG: PHP domain-containing protein [Candidatus Thorarchaeota archaeon]
MNDGLSAFDLHFHTLHSKDGLNNPRTLFKQMKRVGLTGIFLTEHWRPSILRTIQRDGRFLLPACEYKSNDYGEVIGLFIREPIENRSFEEIAEDIKDQNGLVLLPHPRDFLRKHTAVRRGLPDELISKHVDLIEGINSRCIVDYFNTRAQRLAHRLGKPVTAGSDAHSFLEIGHARTWLQNIESHEDIYEELRQGRTQISGHCSYPWVHIPSSIWQRLRKWSKWPITK